MVDELKKSWKDITEKLGSFSKKYNKTVLFTEYGYRSTEYAADGHWKHESDTLAANDLAQANSYEAVFTGIWQEPWIAGGFLWKWHLSPPRQAGFMEKAYSPQGKPAQQIIFHHYRNP